MKRALIIAVVLTALAGVFYFFSSRVDIGDFSAEFPRFFPKEMIADPYIVDLEVLDNDVKLEAEKERVSISYTSHRTIEENIKSFQSYFQANGFLNTVSKDDNASFISASKDKISVGATLWSGGLTKVSILYI